mgnify:CR=1 FL=1
MTPDEEIEQNNGGLKYLGYLAAIVAPLLFLFNANRNNANVSVPYSEPKQISASENPAQNQEQKNEQEGEQTHTRYYRTKQSGLAGLFGATKLVSYQSPGKEPEKEYLDFANKTGEHSNFQQPTQIFQPYVCPDAKEAKQNLINYAPKGYLAKWDETCDENSNARERRNRATIQEGLEIVAQGTDSVLTIHGLVKYGPRVLLEIKPLVTRLSGK